MAGGWRRGSVSILERHLPAQSLRSETSWITNQFPSLPHLEVWFPLIPPMLPTCVTDMISISITSCCLFSKGGCLSTSVEQGHLKGKWAKNRRQGYVKWCLGAWSFNSTLSRFLWSSCSPESRFPTILAVPTSSATNTKNLALMYVQVFKQPKTRSF